MQKEISGGGALFDMGLYHIARLLYLLDTPAVERIGGKIYQETDMDPGRRSESGYDVEELALGFVRFDAGVTLDIIESWAIHLDEFEVSSLAGSKGGIRLDPFSYHSNLCGHPSEATSHIGGKESQ